MAETEPHSRADTEAERILAPFFAARASDEGPRPDLIAAILADAAAVAAARAAPPRRPAWRLPDIRGVLKPFGGFPAAAALAACAVLGFTAGIVGSADDLAAGVWSTTTLEASDDPVVAFFDLGPEEQQ